MIVCHTNEVKYKTRWGLNLMKRKATKALMDWYQNPQRKPLIIRGARQVGKSTLVRLFAKEKGLRLLEINLEKKKSWNSLFETNQVEKILAEIEDFLEVKINPAKDLLFFDECQATPMVLSALRYFYEEFPVVPVIAAGSLLEFALEKHSASLPVGRVEFLHLGPMSFEEYLWACGEERMATTLAHFDFTKDITESLHERALKRQREFLFVGGMPEAVATFVKTKDPTKVKKVLSAILEVYRSDFNKYARDSQQPRLNLVIDYALLHTCEKVKYSNISRDYEAKEIKKSIELLSKAKVISKICNVTSHGLPLKKGIDESVYKLLFLDVGLINIGLRLDWRDIINSSERELLHEGPLAEQFVGQHLLNESDSYGKNELYYWLREGKLNSAEVDFVIQGGQNMIAIEVKSGATGSMRSLHQWNHDIRYERKRSIRFDLNLPSKFSVDTDFVKYELMSLPLYLAAFNPLKHR